MSALGRKRKFAIGTLLALLPLVLLNLVHCGICSTCPERKRFIVCK